MAKNKAVPAQEPSRIGTSITGCTFNNNSAANEHTRAAVIALATASEAHAKALSDIASALKGGNCGPGLTIETKE